jgi:hypothetical protein
MPDQAGLEPPTLETDRLILRAFGPADAPMIFQACQDATIQRYTVPLHQPLIVGLLQKMLSQEWQKVAGGITHLKFTALGCLHGMMVGW